LHALRLWTSSRSNFNKSWQCPKNISIIKGATRKQKGQVNIGGILVGLPAHLAHLHRHRQRADEAAAVTNLCQQQAIKQLGFTTHRPQKTTLIRIIWEAAKWVALSYNVLKSKSRPKWGGRDPIPIRYDTIRLLKCLCQAYFHSLAAKPQNSL